MSESYNTKIIKYLHFTQCKTYLKPIKTDFKKVVDDSETVKTVEHSAERTEEQIQRSVQSSINRTKQSIYQYALSNHWDWFVTLTFNPKVVNSSDYEQVSHVTSAWLNEVHNRRCSDMVYLAVPELHSDKRKYHFHILMSNISNLVFVDSGKTHNNKPIYNLPDWRFGFSTAERIDSEPKAQVKTCNYMLKYITKDLVFSTKGRKRYWVSKSTILKPDIIKYNLNQDEFEFIKNEALNNSTFAKTIDIPVAHNRVNIINVEYD